MPKLALAAAPDLVANDVARDRLGVAADLFDGVLLGEQALRLTAMVFIALRFRSRLRCPHPEQ